MADARAALRAIRDKAAPFVSRGDRSGTHQAELALWKVAGVDLETGNLAVTSDRPIDFDRIVEAVAEAGDYTVS